MRRYYVGDLNIVSTFNSVVTTQIPGNNGYCGGKVVFIDTEVSALGFY